MKIDVDDVLRRVLPWECEFTIDGNDYAVPPPSLGTLKILERFEAEGMKDDAQAARIIDELFGDKRPDLPSKTLPVVQLVTTATLAYTRNYLSKKSQAAALAEAGVPGFSTSGNASSPSAESVQVSPTL